MVNPENLELREKYELLQSKYELISERLARVEGRVTDAAKQTIWQFVVFMVGIGGLIVGLVNYQTSILDKRFEGNNQRFDEINRRIEQGQKDTNARIEEGQKNSDARLERVERLLDELNKELRNRPK